MTTTSYKIGDNDIGVYFGAKGASTAAETGYRSGGTDLKVAPEYVHEDREGKLTVEYSLAAYEQAMFNRGRIAELEARMARAGV